MTGKYLLEGGVLRPSGCVRKPLGERNSLRRANFRVRYKPIKGGLKTRIVTKGLFESTIVGIHKVGAQGFLGCLLAGWRRFQSLNPT